MLSLDPCPTAGESDFLYQNSTKALHASTISDFSILSLAKNAHSLRNLWNLSKSFLSVSMSGSPGVGQKFSPFSNNEI